MHLEILASGELNLLIIPLVMGDKSLANSNETLSGPRNRLHLKEFSFERQMKEFLDPGYENILTHLSLFHFYSFFFLFEVLTRQLLISHF